MKEEAFIRTGLTLKSLIILLLLVITGPWWAILPGYYSATTLHYISLPWIIIVWIFMLLPPKYRLTPQEIAIISIGYIWLYGQRYLLNGVPYWNSVGDFMAMRISLGPAGLTDPTLGEVFNKFLPDYLYPLENRRYITEQLLYGKALGDVFPIDRFIIPAIVHSIYWTALLGVVVFLMFGVVGRIWVEEEKVVFPHSLSMVEVFEQMEPDSETGKPIMFNLKNARAKLFWIGVVIGIIIALPLTLSFIIPALAPYYYEYGEISLKIEAIAAIPGAVAVTVFQYPWMILALMLASNDVLWTGVLSYIIFGVIYHTLAVQLGWVAYSPGIEYRYNWDPAYIGQQLPFPYVFIAGTGVSIGIGIIVLFAARRQIKNLIDIILGRKPDEVDRGLSMKKTAYLGLVSMLLLIIFMSATGVPIIISFAWLIVFVLYWLCQARAWAEFWLHQADPTMLKFYVINPVGIGTGAWPAMPTGENQAIFMTWYWIGGQGVLEWTQRCSAELSSPGLSTFYKVAREAKVNLKYVVIILLSLGFLGFIYAYLFNIWVAAHGGGITRQQMHWAFLWTMSGKGVAAGDLSFHAAAPTWEMGWMWIAIGFVISMIAYIARMKFPALPLNPYMLNPMWGCIPYYWLDVIIALALKLTLVRLFGIKRFLLNFRPIAVGVMLGSGLTTLPTFLYEAITMSFPAFFRYYTP